MVQIEDRLCSIVTENSSLARVLDFLEIEYSRDDERTLAQACTDKGLEPKTVARVLIAVAESIPPYRRANCSNMSLTELAKNIQETHHAYLRQELPRLRELIDEVRERHPDFADFAELQEVFADLQADLGEHILHEEQILFPIVRDIDETYSLRSLQGGSVNVSIRDQNHEHEDDLERLRRIRELTDNFTVPDGASNAWRALIIGLSELDCDLHHHIHKETNILFPRAAETEAWLAARS